MVPHPVLPARYSSIDQKPAFVEHLFDDGAEYYDQVVDWGFLRTGASYRRWAQKRLGLKPGMKVLDVACGTGLVAVAAAQIQGSAENITCLDPSAGMLAVAKKKLKATFVQGRAEQLPFPDRTFDFLTMGYALRHVADLEAAFREYLRVLKPGSRVLIMEVTKPAGPIGRFLFKQYFGNIYPKATRLFTRSSRAEEMMRYFWETMDAFVPPESVLQALRNAGFEAVHREAYLGLFSEYIATRPL